MLNNFFLITTPGFAEAAPAQSPGHTGHVPEVHEASAHRGTIQQDRENSDAVWSPWRSGRDAAEQTSGEAGEEGKLGEGSL